MLCKGNAFLLILQEKLYFSAYALHKPKKMRNFAAKIIKMP